MHCSGALSLSGSAERHGQPSSMIPSQSGYELSMFEAVLDDNCVAAGCKVPNHDLVPQAATTCNAVAV